MKKDPKINENQVNTHEKKVNTYEPVHLKNSIGKPELSEVNMGYENRCTPQSYVLPWKWDILDDEIIQLIRAHFHLRGIARQTGKQPSAIFKRLRRLERVGIISSHHQILAGFTCIIYTINENSLKGCSPFFIHNENQVNTYEEIQEIPYKMHALSFKSSILAGHKNLVGKGKKQYKTGRAGKSWTGEIFTGQNYKIRVTTKTVLIEVYTRLETDTEANLLIRYSTIARDHLLTFSERYGVKLGEVKLSREPHRLLPGTQKYANMLLGGLGGEIYQEDTGLQIDKSQEGGEIEFIGKKGAATLKKAFHVPEVAIIVSAINELKKEIRLQGQGGDHDPGLETRITSVEQTIQQQKELIWRLLTQTEKMIRSSFDIVEDQGQGQKPGQKERVPGYE